LCKLNILKFYKIGLRLKRGFQKIAIVDVVAAAVVVVVVVVIAAVVVVVVVFAAAVVVYNFLTLYLKVSIVNFVKVLFKKS